MEPPLFPATAFDVVAIATSAGGLAALGTILSALPAAFPAAILVVQHLSPDHPSRLAEILARRSALRIRAAAHGESLAAGTVHVAVPDRHLTITLGARIALSDGPRQHHSRPSAEPLFASVALRFGPRAIAVVLTGGDGDGARGVRAVKRAGGVVLAQDAASSRDFSMPRHAIATGDVAAVLPLRAVAAALLALVSTGALDAVAHE